MPLNQKNPILTDSWKRLKEHFNHISIQKIEHHFQINKNRGKELSTNFNEILFDYSKKRIGKPTKDDLKRQKISLPLIYSIKQASKSELRSIKLIFKRKKHTTEDKKIINQFVKEHNGFKYAESVMLDYKKKALKILETFPDNESRNSLKILLDYIIDRKY